MSKLDELNAILKQQDALIQKELCRLLLQLNELINGLEASATKPDHSPNSPEDPYGEYSALFGDMSPDTAQRIFNDWLAQRSTEDDALN